MRRFREADHPIPKALEREFGQFRVGERLVNRLAGEIVVEHFREQHQSVNLSRRPLNDRALVLRRRLGFADTHVAGRRYSHAGG